MMTTGIVRTLSALALGVSSTASAAVIHVNTAAAPGGSGESWATAMNDLRGALLAAQAGDAVFVARGLYMATTGSDRTLNFRVPSGVKVFGGFAGTEASIFDRPEDPDPESADPAHDTILSGEIGAPGFADNTFNVLNIENGHAATTVDRVVVTRGVPGPSFPYNAGGGVRIHGGSPTLTGCLIIDNEGAQGAGLWLEQANGAVIDRCIIKNNRSTGGSGGGILQRFGSVHYTDCIVKGNTASGEGGGLNMVFGTTATITRSLFEENRATPSGGAITAVLNSNLTVEDSQFVNNSAARQPIAANGGAVYHNGGTHVYRRCLFSGNQSQSAGAASDQAGASSAYEECEFISNACDVSGGAAGTFASSRYSDCLFQGNEAGVGGALGLATAATVERCTFRGNFTHAPTNYGGALYLTGTGSTLTDCDFSANTANTAGVAYIAGSGHRFDRCRFTGNSTSASGGVLWHAGGSATYANCLIAGNTAGFGFGSVLFMQSGSAAAFHNCTIVGNGSVSIALYNNNLPLTIANSIVRNAGAEFHAPGAVTASYSNIEGGIAGPGNIDVAPVYIDASIGDYALAPGSPGIDAGSNALVPEWATLDLAGNDRFVDDPATADTGIGPGPVVDMGAYELQAAAPPPCLGDANLDGLVNFADITSVLSNFGAMPVPPPPGPGDANHDGVVNFADITSVLSNFGFVCP